MNKAWIEFENKNYEYAKELWEEILEVESSDSNLAGYCYTLCALGEFEQARVIYLTLWEKTQDHIYLHQLCMLEREAKNYDEALLYLEREAELISPVDNLAIAANLYEYSKISLLKGDLDEALDKAIKCQEFAMASNDYVMMACAHRLLFEIKGESPYFLKSASYFIKADDQFGLDELFDLNIAFEIRLPLNEDVNDLHRIEVENFGADEATELETFEDMVFYIHEENNPEFYYVRVISIANEVVGFICAIKEENEYQLVDIAVAKKWQGNKISNILMNEFIYNHLKEEDIVSLEVRKSNAAAISLYQNFNFLETGVKENYYEDGEDAILMGLRITS